MTSEKRKERRIKVSLLVRIVYQDKREILGNLENISRLGAYVVIGSSIPEGANVSVRFTIPPYTRDLSSTGTGEVRAEANVFRANLIKEPGPNKYYGIGLFFTGFPSQQEEDKLSGYIDFLTFQEENNIKTGIKRWQEKREAIQKERRAKDTLQDRNDAQREMMALLNRIMERLDGIYALLKTKNGQIKRR